jgi:hypothetical protein
MPTELVVKPVLTYGPSAGTGQRGEKTSWREWGGTQTEGDVEGEIKRIGSELGNLLSKADFPLKILPLSAVKTVREVYELDGSPDVTLIYAAGGGLHLLDALTSLGKYSIIFLRHKTGPVYLWYEIAHPIFLRGFTEGKSMVRKVDFEDVVVDDYNEILWRLRALYGLKNTIGRRVVAIGGPSGWGVGRFGVQFLKMLRRLRAFGLMEAIARRAEPGRAGPSLGMFGVLEARKKWKLNISKVSYRELAKRIRETKHQETTVKKAMDQAERYLEGVALHTDKKFVINAFTLYEIFKQMLKEKEAEIITVKGCMSTIMPIAETTACLVLSMLNDEGYMAVCESDFVVIPAAILLHYISGRPVSLVDPCYPHDGMVTLAHCTAPRRMDGKTPEPTELYTHFESDYGVAPRVIMKKGQTVTVIDPDFHGKRWLVFRGKIVDTPFLPICRSQMEVQIEGDWRKLVREMVGFHWVVAYGDFVSEVCYALKKVGIECVRI